MGVSGRADKICSGRPHRFGARSQDGRPRGEPEDSAVQRISTYRATTITTAIHTTTIRLARSLIA